MFAHGLSANQPLISIWKVCNCNTIVKRFSQTLLQIEIFLPSENAVLTLKQGIWYIHFLLHGTCTYIYLCLLTFMSMLFFLLVILLNVDFYIIVL